MGKNKLIPSGDGYFHVKKDPSRGFYGIPPELEEELNSKFEKGLLIEKLRVIKAVKLIKESNSRDLKYKIFFLKRLGYNNLNVRKKTVSLDEAEVYPQNVDRMYIRTLNELREIIRNPNKKSKLVERLDSIQ